MTLAEILRARQEAAQRELDELTAVAPEDFTPENEARAVTLADEIRQRQPELDRAVEQDARAAAAAEAAAQSGVQNRQERETPAVVTREERTYTPEKDTRGEASFFADAYRVHRGDVSARERLERHARELAVEGEQVQQRSTTTTTFAGLVVPQYLVDLAAPVAQAGRPFANTCRHLPLPDQGMVFYLTKGTTNATVGTQATQNTAVNETNQAFTDVQINVVTIAGQQTTSRQALERGTPGLDRLIYQDLAENYAVKVDTQVITGTGTGTKGIQNAGGNQATAFTAAVTATTFYSKVAGGVNSVLTNRYLPPDHIVMHPRRWAWLLSQVDSSARPLIVPQAQGPQNEQGTVNGPSFGTVVGHFQGLPVITDANVPTSVGTGPEDLVFVYRSQDCLLWEDSPLPRNLRFEEPAGVNLSVQFVAYGYMAFTAERYPTGVSIIGGNAGAAGQGLVAPAF